MEVFETEARKIKGAEFLAQGTLYPDVIESVSGFGGPSSMIKSHHNVGGSETDETQLVEPLKSFLRMKSANWAGNWGCRMNYLASTLPGPGLAIGFSENHGAAAEDSAQCRRDPFGGDQRCRFIQETMAVVCGPAADQERGVMGDARHLRIHSPLSEPSPAGTP